MTLTQSIQCFQLKNAHFTSRWQFSEKGLTQSHYSYIEREPTGDRQWKDINLICQHVTSSSHETQNNFLLRYFFSQIAATKTEKLLPLAHLGVVVKPATIIPSNEFWSTKLCAKTSNDFTCST